jgi:hypothetical protein
MTSRIKETCINSSKRIWVKPEKGQIKPERLVERENRKPKTKNIINSKKRGTYLKIDFGS